MSTGGAGRPTSFGIVEPNVGRHLSRVTRDRAGVQFALVNPRRCGGLPQTRTIRLVVDNLNIHHERSLVRAFGAAAAWRRA